MKKYFIISYEKEINGKWITVVIYTTDKDRAEQEHWEAIITPWFYSVDMREVELVDEQIDELTARVKGFNIPYNRYSRDYFKIVA